LSWRRKLSMDNDGLRRLSVRSVWTIKWLLLFWRYTQSCCNGCVSMEVPQLPLCMSWNVTEQPCHVWHNFEDHNFEHHPHHVLLAQEKGHWWRKRSGRESEREIGAVFLWPDAFPFLSPTSTSHSLHLIFSSATNRLLREGTSLAFSSALRCSLCNMCYCV